MPGRTPIVGRPPIRNEVLDRRRRMRPLIAIALMVIVIPPVVWFGIAIEHTISDLQEGQQISPWQLVKAFAGGSLLALMFGFKESVLGTLAIAGGSRLLIRWKLDSIWASLLLGALVGLTVLDAPSVILSLDQGKPLAQAIADRRWQGLWPYFGIAAATASALNWQIVIRSLRRSRLAATR